MTAQMTTPLVLVIGGLALFWVAMLGLLWRRSLVGMLVGILFGWFSVVLTAVGFMVARSDAGASSIGAVLILLAALISGLQVALGLSIVVARVARRGTLDTQDAGLLEG